MKNYFVCPGFAKSGTTLLHSLLSDSSGYKGPKSKESNYFRLKGEKKPYLSLFKDVKHTPQENVFFEFSPTYSSGFSLQSKIDIANRIKKTLPNAKILLTFRHPVYRAFSHYIHQLQAFSRFGAYAWSPLKRNLARGYFHTFEQEIATSPIINPSYFDLTKVYFDIFGADNCMFFYLESDVKDFSSFYLKLNDTFNLDIENEWVDKSIPHIHKGTEMPRYFYGGESGSEIVNTSGDSFFLPARSLYIANNKCHELLNNIDANLGKSLINGQHYWTRRINAETFQRYFENYMKEDLSRFLELCSKSKNSWNTPDYLNYSFKSKTINLVEPDFEFLKNTITAKKKQAVKNKSNTKKQR